jgi:hypothetical protein
MLVERSQDSLYLIYLLLLIGPSQVGAQGWPGHAHDPQHSNVGTGPAQTPAVIRWQTPVDLNPQYSGGDLFIHYGSPVITRLNTVLVPVKTGATDGFRVDAHRAMDGAVLWSYSTDYTQPGHNWGMPLGISLTAKDKAVAIPAAGGTIVVRNTPDAATGTVTRLAFYGISNYNQNPSAFNGAITINTPISMDKLGNYYFGFVSSGAALPGFPNGIPSGLARIPANGTGGVFTSATSIAGVAGPVKVVHNCAPAFTADGSGVYVAVNDGATGYLALLNSATLARIASAALNDPRNNSAAWLPDDGSGTPTVGPDGDIYLGVLETNFPSNHARGWLLHFSADLQTSKIPNAFGWDDTASVVPAGLVPSYTGASTYLLLTKYNNYGSAGGDGINRLAIVDPNVGMVDPVTGAAVMNTVLTVAGVTPDAGFPGLPGAVREWCINSAAIDAATKSAVVNSEDGHVYRWDFISNTLRYDVGLAPPTGEAYTPTVIGPDGAIYAINNATLFSVVRQ